jgi:hypothetical protein
MRTLLTLTALAVLFVGAGLCLLDALASAFAHGHSGRLYRQQLAIVPYKQTYSRAEYTAFAWQVWTNRVHLPAKEAYTPEDLRDVIFGLGTSQDSCDRQTFEALIAEASGYTKHGEFTMTTLGVLTMLVGAFLLGLSSARHNRENQDDSAA